MRQRALPDYGFVEERATEALWRWWLDNMRSTAPLAFGPAGGVAPAVRIEGGERLESAIDELGLRPPLTRRRGLGRRCGEIAMFGLLLRFGQTDLLEDRRFEESQSTNKIRIWPFREAG
jgi:hypothetical protein